MPQKDKYSGADWNKHRTKLRYLYVFLCGFQLAVMAGTIALAVSIYDSYSRSLEYEKLVNADNSAIAQLSSLGQAIALTDPSADASWSERLSRVQYATAILTQKIEKLLQTPAGYQPSPLARNVADLRALLADAQELSSQTQLASRQIAEKSPPAVIEASLVYADRAAARINTRIGNIAADVPRAKSEVLAAQTEQARRSRFYLAPLAILGILLVLPATRYARKLDRQLCNLEAALQEERDLLEERVIERTSELRAEMERRSQVEAFNRSRNQLLEMVAEGETASEVLLELVKAVESFAHPARCIILGPELDALAAIVTVGADDPKLAPGLKLIQLDNRSLAAIGSSPTLLRSQDFGDAGGEVAMLAAGIMAGDAQAGAMLIVNGANWEPTEFHSDLLATGARMAGLAVTHSQLQEELFRRAHHDGLTGLPNRMLCEDRLQQAIARAARNQSKVVVMCVDLDDFKQVNDQYGHVAGDRLLQEVAVRLTSRLRASDTVARVGGDEFVVVVEQVNDRDDVENIAQSLLTAIADPVVYEHLQLRSSGSIGVALYPTDGITVEELKRHADQAMYRAKEHGDTYTMFSSELSEKLERRRRIQQHVRDAIDRDGFEMLYQPQYSVTGTVLGLEALVRFGLPELQHVSPAEFIPIAEETGMMKEVGEKIVEQVCVQMKAWRNEGLTIVPVAINVSALQLEDPDFAKDVAELLKRNQIEPRWVKIEITETAMMSHVEECRRQLLKLERIGVGLSVDDFGTGHSSLNYIHRLPVDTIKIDRSFVQRLTNSEESNAIVRAIVAMARALELTVVAEGVETREQLEAVRALGCDAIQGYLFSKPVNTLAVANILRGNSIGCHSVTAALDPALSAVQAGGIC